MLILLKGDVDPEPDRRRPTRTPQCYNCNRFCRILSSREAYDGQGTQLYVTFDCTRCGVYTQAVW